MESSEIVALASLAVTALVAVLAYVQTRERNRQDLIEAEQTRRHNLDLAKNARYQERVDDLYLEVRAYARLRRKFASEVLRSLEEGAEVSTEDHAGEAAADNIRDRIALYGSDRVTTALTQFHANLGSVFGAIGGAKADGETLREVIRTRDVNLLEQFQTRLAANRAERQERIEALERAMQELDEAMRSDLAS